jgi:transcriptional regulator with XRE-family HTH domain
MSYVSGDNARQRFKDRVWQLRLARDLIDSEVATALGVHNRTLYKWLSGDRRIPVSAVRLLDLLLAQPPHAASQQFGDAAPHNRPSPMLGGERGKGGL